MGALCSCGSSKKLSDNNNVKHKKSVVSESNKTQASNISESNINIHSSQEILDDNFKTQITEAINEHIISVPTAYQTEHDRIVDEMKRSAPERYRDLIFSEYPDVNGPAVDEMARRLVTSNEAKQRLINQIDERIESSFQSRTAGWNSSTRETARPVIRMFIEKHVNEAFDRVELT